MTVDSNKWGIIYVPRAGVSNTQKFWNKIKEYLDFRKVDYESFQAKVGDSIESTTKNIIEQGYRTIVIVGAMKPSTMLSMVSCLLPERCVTRLLWV